MAYVYTADPQWVRAPQGLRSRYEIYHSCATDLGWKVKTFTEWMVS